MISTRSTPAASATAALNGNWPTTTQPLRANTRSRAECLYPAGHKGNKGKGIFFIVAEAAAIGGIVATESLRQSYKSKASSAFDTDQKRRYNSRATNCANVRNGFIVGAAAIYVWNVIDGIAARGKKQPLMVGDARLRISPYAAPQESGVLLSLNF